MVELGAPRARLVELLWQLKRAYDTHGEGGVRYVHFSTLLKDERYRGELIAQAARSRHPEIRELGMQLRELNVGGELTQSPAPLAGTSRLFNPDIAETVGASSHTVSSAASPAAPGPSRAPTAGASTVDPSAPKRLFMAALLALLAVLALLALLAGLQFRFDIASFDLSIGRDVEVVSGSLFGQHHWQADRQWSLEGIVYLEAGAKLTIDAGAVIQGKPGSALVITRGASIDARGSATAPVIFTSAQPRGQRRAGDWGGVVLLGAAPVNARYAQIEGVPLEDRRGAFGGSVASDSCGVLEYVRIEYAGYEVYANNELNGLTLGGCGSNTIIRNVQVHRSLDDGVEIFGGSVDLKNILITGAGDDSLDWDLGWQGRVQHMLVLQYPEMGDNAIEADNLDSDHLALPRSEPQLFNVSLLSQASPEKHQRGMTLRRGTGGHFANVVIAGFSAEAIDIKDLATAAHLATGALDFDGVLIAAADGSDAQAFADELGAQDDDGGLQEVRVFQRFLMPAAEELWRTGQHVVSGADFRLSANSPASRGAVAIPEGEFWDQAANYIGAIRPGSQATWLDGWSDFSAN